jgi:hypothetical protein
VLQTLAKRAFAGAFDDNAVRVMVEALGQRRMVVQSLFDLLSGKEI